MQNLSNTLFAIHNTSALNLNKTLDLGGFPCPSIAIVKGNEGHTGYGDISIIFPISTVDPADDDNYVYSHDAWTPVAPTIQCEVNRDGLSRLKAACKSQLDEKCFLRFGPEWTCLDAQFIEEEVESFDGLETLFEKNPFMQLLYLKSQGMELPTLRCEEKTEVKATTLSPIAKDVMSVLSYAEMEELEALARPENVSLKENVARRGEIYKKVTDLTGHPHRGLQISTAVSSILNAGKVRHYSEWNDTEFLHDLSEKTDCEAYRTWLFKQCEGIVNRWGILNDKSPYRDDGSRRSWDYTHDPLTLESMTNVICQRKDKVDLLNASSFLFKYAAANRLYSMDDIIKASEYLEVVDDKADMESIEHGIAAMAEDIADSIRKTRSVDPLHDNAMTAIVEAAVLDTKVEMSRCLEENREFINLKSDTAERIYDLKEYVNSLPTKYLEAKPHRAVGLDEIGIVMLPDDKPELRERLENLHIDVLEYDHTKPEMRTELLKSVSYLGMTLPEHTMTKTDSHEKEPKKVIEKKKQKGRSM